MHGINLGKIIKKDPEENIVSILPLALLRYNKGTETQSAVRGRKSATGPGVGQTKETFWKYKQAHTALTGERTNERPGKMSVTFRLALPFFRKDFGSFLPLEVILAFFFFFCKLSSASSVRACVCVSVCICALTCLMHLLVFYPTIQKQMC